MAQDTFNPDKFDGDLDISPPDVIHWDSASATYDQHNVVTVSVRLWTEKNFTIYSGKVKFVGQNGFKIVDRELPDTKRIYDTIEGKEVDVYTGGEFTLKFQGFDKLQDDRFKLAITYLGCTGRICLFPYTETIDVPAYFSKSEDLPNESSLESEIIDDLRGEVALDASTAANFEQEYAEKLLSQEGLSLGVLLLIVFLGGLATNLTPCVFPMIPITLRILGQKTKYPIVNSGLYALGIIITYSSLGLIVALSGGVFGSLLSHDLFNYGFALLFALFGVSMLGFGNLSGLQNFGSRIGNSRYSWLNALLMGAAAGLVGAPCTGPILGALITFTAKNPIGSQYLFFIYSCGFALPYLFVGIAANKLAGFSFSSHIQNGTKLIFAAVMFALSFYYLRLPFYQILKALEGHWGLIASISVVMGCLLVALALKKSAVTAITKGSALIPAFVLGFGVFSTIQWVTKVDARNSSLVWLKGESEGYDKAKEVGKPILIDFWAEWCEACKKMDKTTFLNDELRGYLQEEWVLVKLDLTQSSDENDMITDKYKIGGLPVLAMIPKDGDLSKMRKINGYISHELLLEKLKEFDRSSQ